MKKALLLAAFAVAIGFSPLVPAQQDEKPSDAPKFYITSYYDVDVYRQYKKVGTLRRGMRAQVLKTTSKWMLVRYWADGTAVVGWIRR